VTPEVQAYQVDAGLTFWCAPCRRWHRHSHDAGSRRAHCHAAASPYLGREYSLNVAGLLPPDMERAYRLGRRPKVRAL